MSKKAGRKSDEKHYQRMFAKQTQIISDLRQTNSELLEACKLLTNAILEYHLLNIKKRFSLSLAIAAAGKAINAAEKVV